MRRSLVSVYLHLIWATWDRLPLLDPEIERDVYRAIRAKAHELGAEPLTAGGVEDHVHLLAQLPSTRTVADLVGGVKGASAHFITHELRPKAFFRWQGAYAAFSVGLRQLNRAQSYIDDQHQHHAIGSKAVEWERAILADLAPSGPIHQETQPAQAGFVAAGRPAAASAARHPGAEGRNAV